MIEIRHRAIRQGQSTQAAYDDLYEARDLLMRDSFYLWLIELMAPQPGEFLLDVACGQGRLIQLAAAQGLNVAGIDFSAVGMQTNAQRAPKAKWLLGDGEALPLADASVDCLLNIGSLEHYQQPWQGVREMARILKPGGRAGILVPNAYGFLGNIQHVWSTGEIFDDGQPLQRYATRRTWETLLERGGLQVERLVPYSEVNWPRTPQDWLWLARRPQKIMRAALARFIPPNFANQLVFLCRRAPQGPSRDPYPMWALPW
ncbi:MAG: class I SAM-dependent methyltransferase [Caldilineaceae bacterium]